MRRGLISIIAAALCVPAAVGVVLLAGKASAAHDRDNARSSALRAAARIARELLSSDYRTIDRDLARARADTTGALARQYADASTQLRTQALRTHAIMQARVRGTSVVTASADGAVIVAFIDQVSITRAAKAAVPATRLIPSTVQMTIVRTGDRWRVSGLSAG